MPCSLLGSLLGRTRRSNPTSTRNRVTGALAQVLWVGPRRRMMHDLRLARVGFPSPAPGPDGSHPSAIPAGASSSTAEGLSRPER
jgi:hypothetical protein